MEPKYNDKGISPELITELLNQIKMLQGIKDNNQDTIITFYIHTICNKLLIKTNRRIFIPDMKYLVIDLVTEKLDIIKAESTDELQTIQSMSEYDRSVSFGVPEAVKNKLNLIAEKQIDEQTQLINRFKLLYRT